MFKLSIFVNYYRKQHYCEQTIKSIAIRFTGFFHSKISFFLLKNKPQCRLSPLRKLIKKSSLFDAFM